MPRSPDLQLVARLFGRKWRVVAGITCLTTALAAYVAFTAQPVYQARVVVLPVDAQAGGGGTLSRLIGQFGSLGDLAGLGVSGLNGSRDESVGILESRQLLADFIAEHDLIPVLYRDKWDASRKAWKVPADEMPSLARAVTFFDREVWNIQEDKKSGRVAAIIEWYDPAQAAQWANELVDRANAILRKRAVDAGQRSITYLKGQLAASDVVDLRQTISGAIEAQMNTVMLANARSDYALRVIDAATPADARDPIKPKKALLVIAGMLFGLFASAGLIIAWSALAELRSKPGAGHP